MSETDDTDVLLLIPPNFFLVHSSGSEDSLLESSRTVVHKPVSCTAQVLDKLVNQVHTLESRLESLEYSSDNLSSIGRKTRHKTLDTTDSFDDHSLDRKSYTFPRRRRRKIQRKECKRDRSLTSLDSVSTRQSVPSLKLDKITHYQKNSDTVNDTRSMDGDISSIVSTPSKKNDKLLLNEIDEFLTKVESYESPETKFKDQYDSFTPENLIKAAGDYITQKLDSKPSSIDDDQIKLPSGRIVSSSVLDKYIYLVKGNPPQQNEKSVPTNTYKSQLSESLQSTSKHYSEGIDKPIEAPKYDLKTRREEIKSPSIRRLSFSETKVQPTSTPKKPATTTQSYLDTFRPSSNKIYDRATKVLEQYKAQNSRATQSSDSYLSKEEFKMPQMRPYSLDQKEGIKMTAMQHKMIDSIDTELLSLSDLWGERGDRADRIDNIKLEEERLKREHCEALIQQLQKKLLDQQEKLAVALKVDRAKDSAIARLKDAWLRITSSLDKAEERHRSALEKMCREVENFKIVADDAQKKTNHFEAELYKTLDLAHDYQEKCKQLISEKKEIQESTEKLLTAKEDIISSKDKDIEVLKENYETVMRLNKQSTDCVKNLENALEKERLDHEESKLKISELTRKIQSLSDDAGILTQERDLLKEKVNEERARCNMTERQLCEKQNQTSELLEKCDTLDSEVKSLRKHLEMQKSELKCHYQRQLEEAVMSKLQEFQKQLDCTEREMEQEARVKEAGLLDNFNKQLSRIEEQHKLEVNVLEEKQREEIKLYRLQLAQASEKIGLLENKLESYKRRRGQIASQLHSVMESQWRQALLILTSGGHVSSLDLPRPHSVSSPAAQAQDYAPPRIPPLTMPTFADKALSRERPAIDFEALSDSELQHYVKLLLTKPSGLAGGGPGPHAPEPRAPEPEPAEEPTSDRADKPRDRTARRTLNASKPPWKA